MRQQTTMTIKPNVTIPILLLALCSASFPAEDVHDYVLKAYRISPAQEAQFARDGQMSPFWAEWDSANKGGTVVMDYIDMIPALNGWVDGGNHFGDSTDAQVIISAAYGIAGLYLSFRVTDNAWYPPAGTDGLDFLIDTLSSQAIKHANKASVYLQPAWGWSLTYSTVQYLQNIGAAGAALSSYVSIGYFGTLAMMYNRVMLTQIPTDYTGLELDMTGITPRIRQIEWKIPWTWVGNKGGLGKMPAIGKEVAFSPGYNDDDSPTQTGRKSLRWKERDPFNTCLDLHPADSLCDAWGDILITDQNVGIHSNPSHVTPRALSVSHPIKMHLTRNNTISPCIISDKNGMRSYWDLAGKRWNAKR